MITMMMLYCIVTCSLTKYLQIQCLMALPATIQLVIFEGLKFCGLGSLDNFVGSYFRGIPILIT